MCYKTLQRATDRAPSDWRRTPQSELPSGFYFTAASSSRNEKEISMSSRQVLIAIVLLLAAVCSSFGQVGRATITGVVTDSTGAAVPSVTIKATNTATNVGYDSASNEVGNYTIRALPIG